MVNAQCPKCKHVMECVQQTGIDEDEGISFERESFHCRYCGYMIENMQIDETKGPFQFPADLDTETLERLAELREEHRKEEVRREEKFREGILRILKERP